MVDAPPSEPSRKAANKKLRTFDEDDIVRYSLGHDVPVVGLVRDRDEYKEMREMALIYGATLGLGAPRVGPPGDEEVAPGEDVDVTTIPVEGDADEAAAG